MSDENWIFPFFEPRLLRLCGWDSLWSARGGVCVRVCMRLHKKMKQTSLFVNPISFFQLFIGKWKIFRFLGNAFWRLCKGMQWLWHLGVQDSRIASTKKVWWTRKSRTKFHIFKRISVSPFLKMSVGCLLRYNFTSLFTSLDHVQSHVKLSSSSQS